ncbi:CLUMA_CG008643, isoform A, partial [Clunio marinus]
HCLLIFLSIINLSFQSNQHVEAFTIDALTSSNDVHDGRFVDAITKLSLQLEAFNLHYVTKVEDKIANIMQTMNNLDANMKFLQEKAQIWDVFRHHISSWSEQFKSSDRKIDILKKSLENLPVIENQLQNTDFKVQKMFEKTDLINEKLHEITKSMLETHRAPVKQKHAKNAEPSGTKSWSQEDFEQTEILMRLTKIQKLLANSCSLTRLDREMDPIKGSKTSSTELNDESTSLKILMMKVNNNLEKFPTREIKQSFNLNKKQEKALDVITNLANQIDERTIRIFDTNSYQFKKLLTCCKSTEHEILTFTNNANTLLKRTEKAIKAVEASEVTPKGKYSSDAKARLNDFDGSGGSSEFDEETLDNAEYFQPHKTNCFQLTTGRSGVYTFGEERELNDYGRDLNQQYCEYSTEGTAWTIIQKRDNFNPPEMFNRSWADYKKGFGNLSRDFWFGNEFIHKLTCDQHMVLRIVLEDFKDNHVWVEYGNFRVESETHKYALSVDEYRGSIADSFLYHNNQPFSTFDRNNDVSNLTVPCAQSMGSGWWFKSCAESNLNGIYRDEPLGGDSRNYHGIFWEHWLGDYSLKATKMMIRPKDFWLSNPKDENLIELGNDMLGH